MVGEHGGWTTTINACGDVEWIPPPHLDTGQNRVNYYHRPERLLHPPDEPETLQHNDTGSSAPLGPDQVLEGREPESFDPWALDLTGELPAPQPDRDDDHPEPFDPWGDDDGGDPNGPDPFAA
jgi:hypothetical protein